MQVLVWPEGWPVPNYIDPPTRGFPCLFIILCVVTTAVVVLRLYSRYVVTRSPGIDDTFLVAGYILSIGQTVAEYKAVTTWGWNMHLWDVLPTNLEHVRLSAWLIEVFFILGTGCTKISILLVYRRISNGSSSLWFIRLTWVAIAFTAVYMLAFTLEIMLVCRPLNAYWKSYSITYRGSYTCGNERIPLVLSAALSAVSDIYSSVLPMLFVRKLRLSTRQRISLFLLFSVGLLTAGTGVARFYYLWKVTINYQPGPHTHDSTWLGWPVFAWTDIEAHLAIMCACAPALKVFFVRAVQQPLSRAYATSRSDLSRSRSRSSSKGIIQGSQGSRSSSGFAGGSFRRYSQRERSIPIPEVASKPFQQRDVERYPLKKIEEKPLPTWPVWDGPAGKYGNSTTAWSGDGPSSDGEPNGTFLPIHPPSRELPVAHIACQWNRRKD